MERAAGQAHPQGVESVYATARPSLVRRLATPLAARARRRRYALYRRLIAPRPSERVIDIGCGWTGLAAFDHEGEITGIDLAERPGYAGDGRSFVRADARTLPFAEQSFEIAYSNSLLEHVAPADRQRVAGEIRRVAGRYFVQTPNRWFPIEPHVLIPFFQFLPRGLRRRLWRFGISRSPFEDIRLLTAAELQGLFPEARIVRERFGPLTKSLIAVGPAGRVGRE